MTFKQLICRYAWPNIEASFLMEYPDWQARIASYESVYQSLLLSPEADTDLQICVEKKRDNAGNKYVEVTGSKQTRHIADAQLNIPYTLHYTPWSEWLAMPVSAKSFQSFSETAIITHCLVEMTYAGFDEETIQAAAQKIDDTLETMDASDYLNFTSWEDMLKQLNSKAK